VLSPASLAALLVAAFALGWLVSRRKRSAAIDADLLSSLSHEMRTPLNGILGLTQVLLDRRSVPEERELVEMIKASGESLLHVLNDLLDYSRFRTGKVRLETGEFRLRRWLRQTVVLHAPQAHRKGLAISCWVEPAVPDVVVGDSQRLRQVLWNLIANAIKFTERGEILVEARDVSGGSGRPRVRFAVVDTGVGIPAKSRAAIFEPFTQGDNARPEQGGLGLGLAISREIAQTLGGALLVESEPRCGSRFELEVALETREDAVRDAAPAFAGQRALVVGESPWEREVLAKELSALRIEVECAHSIPAARRRMDSGFSLMFLDGRRLDDALACARDAREVAGLSVVLLLLTHQRVSPDVLRSCGVAGTLTRPVAPTHMRRAIEIVNRGERVERPEDVETKGMDRPLLAGVRVLLAEDHPVNRTVVVRLLENLGASVAAAANGREALELWSKDRFHVLVLDLEMPEVDGYGVTREIRAAQGRIPIVALTAHAGEEERERCLRAGMDGFLTKPVVESDLASVIQAVLKVGNPLPVFDREAASGRANGDRDLLAELSRIFLEETPGTLKKLEQAVERGETESIERLAHRMKGALLMLAASRAAEAALALETAATGGHAASLDALLRLRVEVERLEEELRELVLEEKR
jgi:CheY-like chemotaxis protein